MANSSKITLSFKVGDMLNDQIIQKIIMEEFSFGLELSTAWGRSLS